MARAASASFLQLSHHGWPGDLLCIFDGDFCFAALARQAVYYPMGALAADAELSSSVYRKHRGVDDRRDRATALGCVWVNSHIRRLFQIRFGRERAVYSPWIHGTL